MVNSKFTRSIFRDAFPSLRHITPGVVYPCVDTSVTVSGDSATLWANKEVFLSVNRFERKKDVGLAIRAFAGLTAGQRQSCRLVIAGGYDPRNVENSSYHHDLELLAASLKLNHATARTVPTALAVPSNTDVLFLLSVPSAFKETLLHAAKLLVYTPRNEHFGIVPLEAMLAGTPVLAADEGGPVETVVEDETGWLRNVNEVEAWTKVMEAVSKMSNDQLNRIGKAGQRRVTALFSKSNMAATLDKEIGMMEDKGPASVLTSLGPLYLTLGFVAIAVVGAAYLLRKWFGVR